jgi:hypothetical protein
MKDIKTLLLEIREIENMSSVDKSELKPAALNRLKKKLELLKHLVKYLETSPSVEFIKSEIQRIEIVISAKMLEFPESDYGRLSKKDVAKLRKEHEKQYGIPKLRNQLKTLRFLLS